MKMHSGPKVSGRSRRVAADQGWSLRGVPLYLLGSGCIKFSIHPLIGMQASCAVVFVCCCLLLFFGGGQ